MTYVVLDTDVSSRIIKGKPIGGLGPRLTGQTWCVTFTTVGELWQWASVRRRGESSRDHLERWLGRVVVIDSDDGVCRVWARSTVRP